MSGSIDTAVVSEAVEVGILAFDQWKQWVRQQSDASGRRLQTALRAYPLEMCDAFIAGVLAVVAAGEDD